MAKQVRIAEQLPLISNHQFAGRLIQINVSTSWIAMSPLRAGTDPRRLDMTDQSELLSRRKALSLLAALGVAAPVTTLAIPDAEAQTPGMERREDRREDRLERREDRRDDRLDRREDRQDRREDRRDATTGSTGQPAPTGSNTTAAPK